MLRLRIAGGQINSAWVPLRFEGAQLHAIVDNEHWGGRVEMGTAIIVDIRLEESEAMNLHEVLDRLIDRRGPTNDEETQMFHDAVAAHRDNLDDSEDVRNRREAELAKGQASAFDDVSDEDVRDRAAGGDVDAQREYRRRQAIAKGTPKAQARAGDVEAPAGPTTPPEGAQAPVEAPDAPTQPAAPAEPAQPVS